MKNLPPEMAHNAPGTNNSNGNKETRWDRIRKKCSPGTSSSNGLKTETVRRLIETDYIGKHNRNVLQGVQPTVTILNPALVMDVRHEMLRKIPRQLPLATVEHHPTHQRQSCLNHNIAVEERYIDNELNKFRQQLEKNRKKHTVKIAETSEKKKKKKKEEEEDPFLVDNTPLMESLEVAMNQIDDFCKAPLEAFDEMEQLVDDCSLAANADLKTSFQSGTSEEFRDFLKDLDDDEKLLEETIDFQVECRARNHISIDDDGDDDIEFERRTPSPLTPTDEALRPFREAGAKHQAEVRRVRFEDENVDKYKAKIDAFKEERAISSCSDTSDGLDSLISDLAEEALYELQLEEKEELENAKLQSDDVDEKCDIHNCNDEADDDQDDQDDDEIKPSQLKSVENPKASEINGTSPLAIVGESAENQNSKSLCPLVITQMKLPEMKIADNKKSRSSDEDEDDAETATSIHEQNLIIEQLFKSRAQTNVGVMRKYFLKWIHYTTFSKIERETTTTAAGKTDRIHQINVFLDKLRKEKIRAAKAPPKESFSTSQDVHTKAKQTENLLATKKYKNKIKMQQDIIDLQRLKLERQNRLILELKLKKLSDEAKEAREEIKAELKTVIRCGDEKSKAKAKALQLIGNLRDAEDEDEFKRLQGRSLLIPKFVQNMHERAIERSIRHEQAKQRRLQQEAEKEAQKIAQEEAKRLEDEEAKRMRIEALKEKRRLEKMAKIMKEREHQRMIDNNRKAQEFNRHRLLSSIGMEGFKRLLERKREYLRKSEDLRRKVMMRTFFVAWHEYHQFELARRIQNADNLYDLLMKRRAFNLWRSYVSQERSKFYVAIDWYDMKLSTYMFKEWLEHTRRLRVIEKSKMRKAISHYEWNLKFKVLDCWQRLPQVLRLEKETEERRQRWRVKIWDLIPDYTPRLDTFV